MVINLAAFIFVLGITFINSLFGLYSGLLNATCAIVALAVAFGFWEPLNNVLTGQFNLHPAYTEPLGLVLLFVVTLLVLRLLTDLLLRGNVHVPRHVDWIGGGVCGFIIGQICVGVMVLSFLMLPFGGEPSHRFVRLARHPDNEVNPDTRRAVFVEHGLWLRSDAFAVGLFNLLSSGSLRAKTTFATVYPDFPQWVFWTGNTVQAESLTSPIRDNKGDGFTNGLRVEAAWRQLTDLPPETTRYRRGYPSKEDKEPKYEPMAFRVRKQDGKELIGARLVLLTAAADRDAKGTPHHRFRPTMIRLVGDVNGQPRHYVPQVIGGADPRIGNNYRIVDPDTNFSLPASGEVRIDAFFEVDAGFVPRFVEYRRHARAPLTAADLDKTKTPPAMRLAAGGGPAQAAGGRDRGAASAVQPGGGGPAQADGGGDRASGAARFIDTVIREKSGGLDQLPFPVSATAVGGEAEFEGPALVSGRISGDRERLSGTPAQARVTRFKVPEGMRMLQIQIRARQAESLFGQVLNFAGGVVNQYRAVAIGGTTSELVGYYAIVRRDGREFIELFYAPDPAASGWNGMLDFKVDGIRRDLQNQDEAVLGLIFLVPPGACIWRIESSGGRIELGDREYLCVGG